MQKNTKKAKNAKIQKTQKNKMQKNAKKTFLLVSSSSSSLSSSSSSSFLLVRLWFRYHLMTDLRRIFGEGELDSFQTFFSFLNYSVIFIFLFFFVKKYCLTFYYISFGAFIDILS